MKKITAIIILLTTINLITAQKWSEPVLIFTMQGYNDNPDFCVDHSGVIHCVWSHEIEANYRKIYYSKSEDEDDTWTEPKDVLQNNEKWMTNPHLAVDSKNNLYLTYDYNAGDPNNMLVLFTKYNGTNWSEPDTISTNMPHSMYNKIVIDNNDKIYVFWHRSETIYYRFFENDTWSEIINFLIGNHIANLYTQKKQAF